MTTLKNKIKNMRGITLISLVITIIVLIILAGVTINLSLGENGIIKRAKDASLLNKKAQYMEEIQLEIADEYMQRLQNPKNEAFIKSIQTRINNKDWTTNVNMYDASGITQEEEELNTILIVETVENYELFIDVDNSKLQASIRENSFQEIQEKVTVTFVPNEGVGEPQEVKIRTGFSVTLPENTYARENYSFTGWCLDALGTGTKMERGDTLPINEDTTIYATWSKEVYTITFEPNTLGIGNSYTQSIDKGSSANLVMHTFTTDEAHYFLNWNTQADGTGTTYTDKQNVTPNSDITLYAQWQQYYVVTYYANNGTSETVVAKTKQSDKITIIGENDFTPLSSKYLKSWNTKPDNSGTEYEIDSKYTLSGSIELYGNWDTITISTITFNIDSQTSNNVKCKMEITYMNESGNEINETYNNGEIATINARVNSFIKVTSCGTQKYNRWALGESKFISSPAIVDGSYYIRFKVPETNGECSIYAWYSGTGGVQGVNTIYNLQGSLKNYTTSDFYVR